MPNLRNRVLLLPIILLGLGLFSFPKLSEQWKVNSSSILLSHLLFSSNETLSVTPELASAIQITCVRRVLDCAETTHLGSEGQSINLVDLFDTLLFSKEKSPLYFLNKPYILLPTDLYINGNGNFKVSESGAIMYGTNYIEFRIYMPYDVEHGQMNISMKAVNSKPAPIEFDILVEEVVVSTIRFTQGDGLETTESSQIDLPSGYHHIKILYANDWFDAAKGIDRNAYIRELTLTPKNKGL